MTGKTRGPWQNERDPETCADCGSDAFRIEGLYVGRHVSETEPDGSMTFGYPTLWLGNVMTCAKCGHQRRWCFGRIDGSHYGIGTAGEVVSLTDEDWAQIRKALSI